MCTKISYLMILPSVAAAVVTFTLTARGQDAADTLPSAAETPIHRWYADTVACYQDAEGFEGTFTHEVLSVLDKRSAPMTGEIMVSKSGKFKLMYSSPSPGEVLYDGRRVRAWNGEDGVVFTQPQKYNQLFSNLVNLFGKPLSHLNEYYRIRQLGSESSPVTALSLMVLELVPLAQSAFVREIVVTIGACPCVRRIIIVDQAGNMIRLTFDNVRLVQKFAAGTFGFKPPKGTLQVHP